MIISLLIKNLHIVIGVLIQSKETTMKKQQVILHIINNTHNAVLVEYVDSNYCSKYPTFDSLKGFQNSPFYNKIEVIDENRYDSFDDSDLWNSEKAFDADVGCV